MNPSQNRNNNNQKIFDNLADRLRNLREINGYTQEELALTLGYASKTTVSHWETKNPKLQQQPDFEHIIQLCKLYGCHLNDIIGDLESTDNQQLMFARRTPQSNLLTPDIRVDIQLGVEILSALLKGTTLEELYELPGLGQYRSNPEMIFAFLRTALISGEIIFTQVPLNHDLEAKLVKKFPRLKDSVYVVDLPETMITEALPPELIAWTAAQQILCKLNKPSRIGLGFGHTLHRMCLIAPPKAQQFNGTCWVPLIAYKGEEDINLKSANFLADLMKYRHHNSTSRFLPYVSIDNRLTDKHLEDITIEWESLNFAFVGGFGWDRTTKETNFRVPPSYRRIYRNLERTQQIDSVAGEFLGYILDKDGNFISQEDTDKSTTRIDLNDIKKCAKSGKVYFVGGGIQKTPVIKVTLQLGCINGLVTDSNVAKALLEEA